MAFKFETRLEFVAAVKEKYPTYKAVPDAKLYDAMVEKYPVYKTQIKENMSNVLSNPENPGTSLAKAQEFAVNTTVDSSWIGPKPSNTEALAGYQDYIDLVEKRTKGDTRGFSDALVHADASFIPFAGDFLKIDNLVALKGTAEKLQQGQAVTDQEVLDLNKFIETQKWMGSSSIFAEVTDLTKSSLIFMLEMWASGIWGKVALKATSKGAEKVGAKALSQAITRLITNKGFGKITATAAKGLVGKQVAGKLITQGVADFGAKAAAVALNTGLGGAFVTALKTGTTLSNTARNEFIGVLTGNDDLKKHAFYKGLLDNYFENVSELSGEALGKMLSKTFKFAAAKIPAKYLEKIPLEKAKIARIAIGRWFASKMGNPEKVKEIMGLLAKGAYNGPFNEMLEERYGGFLKGLFGVNGKAGIFNAFKEAIPSLHQLAVESIAFSVPYGASVAVANYGKFAGAIKDFKDKRTSKSDTEKAGSLKTESTIPAESPFNKILKEATTKFPKFTTKLDTLNKALHSNVATSLQKIPLFVEADNLLSTSMSTIDSGGIFKAEASKLYDTLSPVERQALGASFDLSSLSNTKTNPIGGTPDSNQAKALAKQQNQVKTFNEGVAPTTKESTAFANKPVPADATNIKSGFENIDKARQALPEGLVVTPAAHAILTKYAEALKSGDSALATEALKDARTALKDSNKGLSYEERNKAILILSQYDVLLQNYAPGITQSEPTKGNNPQPLTTKPINLGKVIGGATPIAETPVTNAPIAETPVTKAPIIGTPIVKTTKKGVKLGKTIASTNIGETTPVTNTPVTNTPVTNTPTPSKGIQIGRTIPSTEKATNNANTPRGITLGKTIGGVPITPTAPSETKLKKGEITPQEAKDLQTQVQEATASIKKNTVRAVSVPLTPAFIVIDNKLNDALKPNNPNFPKTAKGKTQFTNAIHTLKNFLKRARDYSTSGQGADLRRDTSKLRNLGVEVANVKSLKELKSLKDLVASVYTVINSAGRGDKTRDLNRKDTAKITKLLQSLKIDSIGQAPAITDAAVSAGDVANEVVRRVQNLVGTIGYERAQKLSESSVTALIEELKATHKLNLENITQEIHSLLEGASVASVEAGTATEGITPAKVLDLIESISYNPEAIARLSQGEMGKVIHAALLRGSGNTSKIYAGSTALPADIVHEMFHHILLLLPNSDMLTILDYLVQVHGVQLDTAYFTNTSKAQAAHEKEFWQNLYGVSPSGVKTKPAEEIVVDAFLHVLSGKIDSSSVKNLTLGQKLSSKAQGIVLAMLPKGVSFADIDKDSALPKPLQTLRLLIARMLEVFRKVGALIRSAYKKRGTKTAGTALKTVKIQGTESRVASNSYALTYSDPNSAAKSLEKDNPALTNLFINLVRSYDPEHSAWSKDHLDLFDKAIAKKREEISKVLVQTRGDTPANQLAEEVASVLEVITNMAYNVATRSNLGADFNAPQRETINEIQNTHKDKDKRAGAFPVISPRIIRALKTKYAGSDTNGTQGRVFIGGAVRIFYSYPWYNKTISKELIDKWYDENSSMSGVDGTGTVNVSKENFDHTIKILSNLERGNPDTSSPRILSSLNLTVVGGKKTQYDNPSLQEGFELKDRVVSGISHALSKGLAVGSKVHKSAYEARNIASLLDKKVPAPYENTDGAKEDLTLYDVLLSYAVKNWHKINRLDYTDIEAKKQSILNNMVAKGREILRDIISVETENAFKGSESTVLTREVSVSPDVIDNFEVEDEIVQGIFTKLREHFYGVITPRVIKAKNRLANNETGSSYVSSEKDSRGNPIGFPTTMGIRNEGDSIRLLSHIAVLDAEGKLLRYDPIYKNNKQGVKALISAHDDIVEKVLPEVPFYDEPAEDQAKYPLDSNNETTPTGNRVYEIAKGSILKTQAITNEEGKIVDAILYMANIDEDSIAVFSSSSEVGSSDTGYTEDGYVDVQGGLLKNTPFDKKLATSTVTGASPRNRRWAKRHYTTGALREVFDNLIKSTPALIKLARQQNPTSGIQVQTQIDNILNDEPMDNIMYNLMALDMRDKNSLFQHPGFHILIRSLLTRLVDHIEGVTSDAKFVNIPVETLGKYRGALELLHLERGADARRLYFARFGGRKGASEVIKTIVELLGVSSVTPYKATDQLLAEAINSFNLETARTKAVGGYMKQLLDRLAKGEEDPGKKVKKKVNDETGRGIVEATRKEVRRALKKDLGSILGGSSGALFSSSEDTTPTPDNVLNAFEQLALDMGEDYAEELVTNGDVGFEDFKNRVFRARAKAISQNEMTPENRARMELYMDSVLEKSKEHTQATLSAMLERLGVDPKKKKISDFSDKDYERIQEELRLLEEQHSDLLEAYSKLEAERDIDGETGDGTPGGGGSGGKDLIDSNSSILTEDKIVAKIAARMISVPKPPRAPDSLLATIQKGILRALRLPPSEPTKVVGAFKTIAETLRHANLSNEVAKKAAKAAYDEVLTTIADRLEDPSLTEEHKNNLLFYGQKIKDLQEQGLPITLIASSRDLQTIIRESLDFLNTSIKDWVAATPLQKMSNIDVLGGTIRDELTNRYKVHPDVAELVSSYVKVQVQEKLLDYQVKHLDKIFKTTPMSSKPVRPWASRLMRLIFAGALEDLNDEEVKAYWENELSLRFDLEGGVDKKTVEIMNRYSAELEQLYEASPLTEDFSKFEHSPQYIEWLARFTTEMKHIKGYSRLEKTIAIFFPNILTGLSVAETNLVSTAANTLTNVFVKSVNDYIQDKKDGKVRDWGSFFSSMKEAWRGFKESRKYAMDILKTGIVSGARFTSAQQLGKQIETDILEHSPFQDTFAVLNNYKYVGRSLKAQDYIFARTAAKHDMFNILNTEALHRGYTQEETDLWIALHTIGTHAGYDLSTPEGMTKAAEKLASIKEKHGETSNSYLDFLSGFATVNKANTIAVSEGFVPGTFAFHSRTEGIIHDSLPESLKVSARRSAGRATFNIISDKSSESDPIYDDTIMHGLAQGIQLAKKSVPALQFVVPFTDIISKVLNTSLDYLPFVSDIRIKKRRKATHRKTGKPLFTEREIEEFQLKRKLGLVAIGGLASIVTLAAIAAGEGEDPWIEITAVGPRDRKMRNQLRETGFRENTIRVGDTHFDYSLTPFAIPFAILGSLADYYKYDRAIGATKEEDEGMATAVAYATIKTIPAILNQSFLTNLSDFLEILMGDNEVSNVGKLKKFMARIGTSVIPGNLNLLKQIARTLDPTLYSADTMAELVMRELPLPWIKSSMLIPRINAFGEEITLGSSAASLGILEAMARNPKRLGRFISFNNKKSDKDWMYVVHNQLRIPIPSRSTMLGGLKMSDRQLYVFSKIKGTLLKSLVRSRRLNGKWIGVSREDQQRDISRVSSRLSNWIKAAMMSGDYDTLRNKSRVLMN